MENSLPKGWVELSLEDITSYIIGGDWGIDALEDGFEKIYVIRGTDYKAWDSIRAKKSAVRYVKSSSVEKRELREGDMVLEVSGGGPDQPVGRVIIIDKRALESTDGKLGFSNFFRLIRIAKPLNPFFIKYYLDYAYSIGEFNEMQSHTTNLRNLRVNEFLSKTLIPLPPLPEQQRIVAKLDELMVKIDRSRARLERIPQILKRFRQSVLSAAVSGKGPDVLSDDVCSLIQIGPFGTQLHRHDYISNGIPIINPTHIQGGMIIPDFELTITKSKYKELQNYHLINGDVIMGRRGEMARCALISDKESGWLCGTGSLFFRPDQTKITPKYLYWLLTNSNTKEFLESESKGTTMSNLNLSIAKKIPVKLPSLREQNEVIKRVEQLYKVADKIEARYYKAKAQLDKLPQSLLAKAFRGELVPQDEKDEPASVLLQRIKKEKATSDTGTKKSKKYKLEEERLSLAAEK